MGPFALRFLFLSGAFFVEISRRFIRFFFAAYFVAGGGRGETEALRKLRSIWELKRQNLTYWQD